MALFVLYPLQNRGRYRAQVQDWFTIPQPFAVNFAAAVRIFCTIAYAAVIHTHPFLEGS